MTNYGRGRDRSKLHLEDKSAGSAHWSACGHSSQRVVGLDNARAITCKRCLEIARNLSGGFGLNRGDRVRVLVAKQRIRPISGRPGVVETVKPGTVGTVRVVDREGVTVEWPGGQLGYWTLTYKTSQVEKI